MRLVKYFGKKADYLILIVVYCFSVAFLSPTLRSDGVAYYAYVRSLVIDGDLDFRNEFSVGNPAFLEEYRDEKGTWRPELFTKTGYLMNRYSPGPALLWSPFFLLAHGTVLGLRAWGMAIPADGYSPPYLWLCALGSSLYAFVGLFLSYLLCREFFSKNAALAGVFTLWFASSLPVYMYFLPFMSHAHSVFTVALFLYVWHRTKEERTLGQWGILGGIAGLMISVYYLNVVFLLPLFIESVDRFRDAARGQKLAERMGQTGKAYAVFALSAAFALVPLILIKYTLYGSLLNAGYENEAWYWTRPQLLAVLFSSYHGLLTWTPVVLLSLTGFVLLLPLNRQFGIAAILVFAAFLYIVASYQFWHAASSFGNRFFLSLTPLFILGLAALYQRLGAYAGNRLCYSISFLLVVWNILFMFQWGTNMIPKRTPISWSAMIYNQIYVAPKRIGSAVIDLLRDKAGFYRKVEKQDYENFLSGKDAGRWKK
jgi:hypothetical protein